MRYSALDMMTSDLVKATLEESLESAYLKMKNKRIRHLPVADDAGKIVGIISNRDVFRGMQSDLRDWHSVQVEGGDFDPADKVKDFMSWPVKTVSYNTDLRVVIDKMIKEKVSAYLVSYDERVLGIVTSEDLLKLLYELLEEKYFEVKLPAPEKTWIGNLLGRVGQWNPAKEVI